MKLTKKETIFVLIGVFLVLLLVIVPALAVDNGNGRSRGPKKADGIWCYMPDLTKLQPAVFYNSYPDDPITDYGQPGKWLAKIPYTAEWSGTLTGQSKEYGIGIFHDVGPMVFLDTILFDEVEVEGRTGGLSMDAFGNRKEVGADWKGTWVITAGTGELENIKGHGTFWGPGWLEDPNECGVIYYKVKELEFD
jgi:hypothetical protein